MPPTEVATPETAVTPEVSTDGANLVLAEKDREAVTPAEPEAKPEDAKPEDKPEDKKDPDETEAEAKARLGLHEWQSRNTKEAQRLANERKQIDADREKLESDRKEAEEILSKAKEAQGSAAPDSPLAMLKPVDAAKIELHSVEGLDPNDPADALDIAFIGRNNAVAEATKQVAETVNGIIPLVGDVVQMGGMLQREIAAILWEPEIQRIRDAVGEVYLGYEITDDQIASALLSDKTIKIETFSDIRNLKNRTNEQRRATIEAFDGPELNKRLVEQAKRQAAPVEKPQAPKPPASINAETDGKLEIGEKPDLRTDAGIKQWLERASA